MSLPRLAVRICTVRALHSRTLVGAAVHDSQIEPADVLAANERRPFISVYTDDGSVEPTHADPLSGQVSFALVIEFGVVAMTQPAPDEDPAVVQPFTDAQLELTLDRIERQVRRALRDETNPWSALWRTFVTGVNSIKSARGGAADKGVRFAGRQLEMQVESLSDPESNVLGNAAGPWARFVALLEDDPETMGLGEVIRAEIEDSPASMSQHFAGVDRDALGLPPALNVGLPAAPATRILDEQGNEL